MTEAARVSVSDSDARDPVVVDDEEMVAGWRRVCVVTLGYRCSKHGMGMKQYVHSSETHIGSAAFSPSGHARSRRQALGETVARAAQSDSCTCRDSGVRVV